ncbi:MAG: extracellular solute-binding protein [Candidatus Magasanikbacteria bacterium]|nr:extracellular solute-binding protein [Candidatus Magasanikbacteria bacterium]
MFKRSLATILLLSTLVLTGLGCSSTPAVPASALQPITLQYWGVFTDTDDMAILVNDFQKNHPNITIQYRKFRPDEYEQKLLQAFADDRAPDLFSIQNSWLPKYKSKLTPMPAKLTYPVLVTTGSGYQQKTTAELQSKAGLTLKDMRTQFVQTVEADTMDFATATSTQKSIFALPFYVDTLALYYNKDILAQNGIVKPAADWNELRVQAEKLSKRIANTDTITQSAVAIGTGVHVHRASDILISLMSQNGAQISGNNGVLTINGPGNVKIAKGDELPAARALRFYLDFSNPNTKAYSWTPDFGDSLDAFTHGRVAYYFGYSYDMPSIRAQNPRLNFDVTAMPQFEKPSNIANYWMEGVTTKSKNKDAAWLFILETATNKDSLAKYLRSTHRVAALNDLIQTELDDIDLGVFAKQNLTARSWYHGTDSGAADKIISDLIDQVRAKLLSGDLQPQDEAGYIQNAINIATQRLNNTL